MKRRRENDYYLRNAYGGNWTDRWIYEQVRERIGVQMIVLWNERFTKKVYVSEVEERDRTGWGDVLCMTENGITEEMNLLLRRNRSKNRRFTRGHPVSDVGSGNT